MEYNKIGSIIFGLIDLICIALGIIFVSVNNQPLYWIPVGVLGIIGLFFDIYLWFLDIVFHNKQNMHTIKGTTPKRFFKHTRTKFVCILALVPVLIPIITAFAFIK